MTAEKTEFVILKLRSGDEIIAKRNGAKKGVILLSRPLVMQRSTLLDPLTGNIKKNICVFRDWLEFTTQNECEIPTDFIVMEATPSPDIIKRYTNELEIMDKPQPQRQKAITPSTKQPKDLPMEEMMRYLMGAQNQSKEKEQQNTDELLSKLLQSSGLSQMVTATFSMPPDVFLNIVLNMPMFDGWGQDIDDFDDDEDGGDGDIGGEEPPAQPKPPQGKQKKTKKDDDLPPGWNGRFGFPK